MKTFVRPPVAETSLGELVGILAPAFVILGGVVGYLFKLYVDELRSQRDSWKKLAEEGLNIGSEVVANGLRAKGMPVVEQLEKVKPEHNSPSSPKQKEAADLATANAKFVAMVLAAQKLGEANDQQEPVPVKVEIVHPQPVPVTVVDEEKK